MRQEFQSYWLRQNILTEFERHNIKQERIHFSTIAWRNATTSIATTKIDFTLDTFPVTGGTTTTDALWMGVPVVGLKGPNVHQRVSVPSFTMPAIPSGLPTRMMNSFKSR